MATIEKSIRNEIRKWASFEMDIYIINNNIRTYCYLFIIYYLLPNL